MTPHHKVQVELILREDQTAEGLRKQNAELLEKNRELSSRITKLLMDEIQRSSDLRTLLEASIEVLSGYEEHRQLVKLLKKRLKEESQ